MYTRHTRRLLIDASIWHLYRVEPTTSSFLSENWRDIWYEIVYKKQYTNYTEFVYLSRIRIFHLLFRKSIQPWQIVIQNFVREMTNLYHPLANPNHKGSERRGPELRLSNYIYIQCRLKAKTSRKASENNNPATPNMTQKHCVRPQRKRIDTMHAFL